MSDEHDSDAMIALVPPKDVTGALTDLAGGADDDQHVTVIYLPDVTSWDLGEFLRALGEVVASSGGVSGIPNGWGRFSTDDGSCLICLWDIVGWSAFRERIAEALHDAGFEWEETHGSIPHQTMRYDEDGDTSIPKGFPDVGEIAFDGVHVWWRGEKVSHIPFGDLARTARSSGMRINYHVEARKPFDESKVTRGGDQENAGRFSKNPGGPREKTKKPRKGPSGKEERKPTEPRQYVTPKVEPNTKRPVRAATPEEAKANREKAAKEVRRDPFPDEKDTYTEEERIERGDKYGSYLPAGDFPEGDPRNSEEFLRIHDQVAALTKKYSSADDWEETGVGGDTQMIHDKRYNPDTGDNKGYTRERREVHNKIIAAMVRSAEDKSVPKDAKMVMMGGPSGAGKSTFLEANGEKLGVEFEDDPDRPGKVRPKNFITINPDDFKELLPVDMERYPGLNENETAEIRHEESSDVALLAARVLMSKGYNVILDITLNKVSSTEKKYITPEYAQKYTDIKVAFVDGTIENSLNNAGIRWKKPDRETGKRAWSGRFLPTPFVEHQRSDVEGYRSKNAVAFEEFAEKYADRITASMVFDPETQTLHDGHKSVYRGQKNSMVRLRTLLKMSVADTMKVEGREATVSEINQKIEAFNNGGLSEDALVKFLTEEVRYEAVEDCPHPKNSPEWYEWHEDKAFSVGTFDDVTVAFHTGKLPEEVYNRVLDANEEKYQRR